MADTRRVTMKDIALELGITTITVSRAFAGNATVRAETRQRILETAERLGYRYNQGALHFRRQRFNSVAVVVEMTPSHERSMSEPCPLSLLGSIMQELTFARHNMVLTSCDMFADAPPAVDGVILIGQGRFDTAEEVIARSGLPYVIWGARHDDAAVVFVGSDNVKGGQLAADHLRSRDRQRFLLLGDSRHREVADRFAGFRDALTRDESIQAEIPCEFTAISGEAAMHAFLAQNAEAFDGVFAASDSIALGCLSALKARGYVLPERVGLVGFDDSPLASHSTPSLTSVRQDWSAGGAMLAQKVLTRISGERVASATLDVSLTVRES